jgi:2,3-bisphosphoglycerate-dependent phosphoglycerate mutase
MVRAGSRPSPRVRWFLCDLAGRWAGRRVLVIGHVATRWGFDHLINGVELTDLIETDFAWREGWEYQLDHTRWQRRQP